jgi:hypothetical protein
MRNAFVLQVVPENDGQSGDVSLNTRVFADYENQ